MFAVEINAVERLIRDHPLFCGLDDDHIRLLAGCGTRTHFRAGQYAFHQGDEANCFFILESGQVALEMQTPLYGPVPIAMLMGGDVLGWSWLFPPFCWHFDARVLEPTKAVMIDAHYLRARCHEDDHLCAEITRRFAQVLMQRLVAAHQKLAGS